MYFNEIVAVPAAVSDSDRTTRTNLLPMLSDRSCFLHENRVVVKQLRL